MSIASVGEIKRIRKVIKPNYKFLEPQGVLLRIQEKGKINLLNIMLQIYEKMVPNYKEKHSEIERDKYERGVAKAKLPEDYNLVGDTIKTVKDKSYEFYEIRKDVFNMFYANKIAHQCKDAEEGLVYYLYATHKEDDEPKIRHRNRSGEVEYIDPRTRRGFDMAYKKLHSYFVLDPSDDSNTRQIAKLKNELIKYYALTEEDLEFLERLNFRELANTTKNAMYIKDMSIASLRDELIKEDENGNVIINPKYANLSFGITNDDLGQTVFVVDLPGYQQIAVHVKDTRLISQINAYPYKIFERKNVLIRKPEFNSSDINAEDGLIELGNKLAEDNIPEDGHRVLVAHEAGREELNNYYIRLGLNHSRYYPTYPSSR